NPWWRETLILRGGITQHPNDLIRQVCLAMDRRYMSLLGLQFTSEPKPDVDSLLDAATVRLEGIVTVEVALTCARQRASELDERTLELLRPFILAVANNGSLIEQVRLARGLKGVPFALSHGPLSNLAASSSDWLVNEVFDAIDRKDYTDPRF